MTTTGILAVELRKGSVNGDHFFDYVRGSLIPEILPFDGRCPKSIAVVDNCSIHHVQPVKQLFMESYNVFFPLTAQTSCQWKKHLATSSIILYLGYSNQSGYSICGK